MMIYILVVEDRHSDPDVTPFADGEKAIKRAKELALEYAATPEDVEEDLNPAMKMEEWIYYARYSVEGDCVWVVKKEIIE